MHERLRIFHELRDEAARVGVRAAGTVVGRLRGGGRGRERPRKGENQSVRSMHQWARWVEGNAEREFGRSASVRGAVFGSAAEHDFEVRGHFADLRGLDRCEIDEQQFLHVGVFVQLRRAVGPSMT